MRFKAGQSNPFYAAVTWCTLDKGSSGLYPASTDEALRITEGDSVASERSSVDATAAVDRASVKVFGGTT